MTMLADRFDAVIGVDTHQDTHTASVVATTTGAVLEELTVTADADGYVALVALADRHSGLRVWSVQGTGNYGAGLTAHLQELGGTVIEIERPNRPARRNGKSEPIDAVRGAREALSLEHHAAAATREATLRSIVASWRPDLLELTGSPAAATASSTDSSRTRPYPLDDP